MKKQLFTFLFASLAITAVGQGTLSLVWYGGSPDAAQMAFRPSSLGSFGAIIGTAEPTPLFAGVNSNFQISNNTSEALAGTLQVTLYDAAFLNGYSLTAPPLALGPGESQSFSLHRDVGDPALSCIPTAWVMGNVFIQIFTAEPFAGPLEFSGISVTVTPAPQPLALAIGPGGAGNVRLSWLAQTTTVHIERAETVAGPWTEVWNGTGTQVELPATGPSGFYRAWTN